MTPNTKTSSPATPRRRAHPAQHPGIMEVALMCAGEDARSRAEVARALELCEAVIDRWLAARNSPPQLELLPAPPPHQPAPDELHPGDDDEPDVELAGHPQAHEGDGDARAA